MKAILLGFLLAATSISAAEVQVGTGATVLRGMAPIADVGVIENLSAHFFAQQSLTYVGPSTFGNDKATANGITRGLLGYRLGFLEFAAGGSYMINPWPYNGGRWNFNLQTGIRFGHLSATYIHFSDAGLTKSNIGRDMVLLGWRF